MSELKCGCRPGYYLCPEAVTLWAAVGTAYEKWCAAWRRCSNVEEYQQEYEQAKAAYDKHVEGVSE